jgi:hypothetical protein
MAERVEGLSQLERDSTQSNPEPPTLTQAERGRFLGE